MCKSTNVCELSAGGSPSPQLSGLIICRAAAVIQRNMHIRSANDCSAVAACCWYVYQKIQGTQLLSYACRWYSPDMSYIEHYFIWIWTFYVKDADSHSYIWLLSVCSVILPTWTLCAACWCTAASSNSMFWCITSWDGQISWDLNRNMENSKRKNNKANKKKGFHRLRNR